MNNKEFEFQLEEKEILEMFRQIDEFHLEYKESDLKVDTSPKIRK